VKKQVHDYKDNNNAKKVDSYRSNILEIEEKLANMSAEMKHINEQEKDLDMEQGEYPIIGDLKLQIKPYKLLWDLYAQYKDKFEDAW
jgi:hypothetical protein|tara:strand:- start:171 stop:431 length:261 start_codon:yes stop_codon:yes gene_type:complete